MLVQRENREGEGCSVSLTCVENKQSNRPLSRKCKLLTHKKHICRDAVKRLWTHTHVYRLTHGATHKQCCLTGFPNEDMHTIVWCKGALSVCVCVCGCVCVYKRMCICVSPKKNNSYIRTECFWVFCLFTEPISMYPRTVLGLKAASLSLFISLPLSAQA